MTAFKHAKSILWEQVFHKNHFNEKKSKIKFLKTIPFFDGLSFWQMSELLNIMLERSYNQDEYIFEEDQPGAALFILRDGAVDIEITDERTRRKLQVAELKPGSFFGEMALINGDPRSASARAQRPTKVFAFFREHLDALGKSHPEIAAKIYKALAGVVAERLKVTNDRLTEQEKAA